MLQADLKRVYEVAREVVNEANMGISKEEVEKIVNDRLQSLTFRNLKPNVKKMVMEELESMITEIVDRAMLPYKEAFDGKR